MATARIACLGEPGARPNGVYQDATWAFLTTILRSLRWSLEAGRKGRRIALRCLFKIWRQLK
jgi:hypothetical protein